MTGGYLERVVGSGTTSLRDVRGSIPGAPPRYAIEEQSTAGGPIAHDETVIEADGVWPDVAGAAALDREGDAPLTRAAHRPSSPPPDITAAHGEASNGVPVTHVQRPARPGVKPSVDIGLRQSATEEQRSLQQTAPMMPSDGTGTGAHVPSLKHAGIRSVLPSGEVIVASGARRKPPDKSAATAAPLDARVEQWQRLRDRLLLEHYDGGPDGRSRRSATSKSNVSSTGEPNPLQPAVRSTAAGREIVIEQLEVVVAAPHPAAPAPQPPSSRRPRSGAWSVATRRYLGKL